jgi:hypothetical protein
VASAAVSDSWPVSPATRSVLQMGKGRERSRDSRPHLRNADRPGAYRLDHSGIGSSAFVSAHFSGNTTLR